MVNYNLFLLRILKAVTGVRSMTKLNLLLLGLSKDTYYRFCDSRIMWITDKVWQRARDNLKNDYQSEKIFSQYKLNYTDTFGSHCEEIIVKMSSCTVEELKDQMRTVQSDPQFREIKLSWLDDCENKNQVAHVLLRYLETGIQPNIRQEQDDVMNELICKLMQLDSEHIAIIKKCIAA